MKGKVSTLCCMGTGTFDPELLKFLGEPLSKKPLRSAAYCITKYR